VRPVLPESMIYVLDGDVPVFRKRVKQISQRFWVWCSRDHPMARPTNLSRTKERDVLELEGGSLADDTHFVYQPLSFKPSISVTVVARLLVAAIILPPALIILGVVLVVRRIRKRRTIDS
jgi:hypothetical protein